MVRLGFFLGFLIGGAVATLLARSNEEHSQALVGDRPPPPGKSPHPIVDRIAQQVSNAQDAAREAQLEKEAEMQQLYEEMVHREPRTP
jgi:hypothetical protein